MTQWLLEEALLERLDAERELEELLEHEQRELHATAEDLKRQALEALEGS